MSSPYATTDGIAEIRWSNPPVESLNLETRMRIHDSLLAALNDPAVSGIVLAGGATNFSGGADVREFNTPAATTSPDIVSIGRLMDDADKPVIAAISGVALGGGLELALACHFRVASASARLGLPEVKLGLLPGAGGTQRLPRLIGAERAIGLMTTGQFIDGAEAKRLGLVDAVANDPAAQARRMAREMAEQSGPLRRARDLPIDLGSADLKDFFAPVRKSVAKTSRGAPAPMKIVDCVEAAVGRSFEEGMSFERKGFEELVETPESAALRHVFFAERAAGRVADLPRETVKRTIRLVGVVGAGTMGTGIAMAFANGGLPVRVCDASEEALERSRQRTQETYASAASRGRMTSEEADARYARISYVTDLKDLADVDLVVEAVFEDMDVKRAVFQRLDSIVRQGAILATNTSFLNVDAIARETKRPSDVIGLHFFSPANIMRLVEVVRGRETAPDVLATAMDVAKRIGKVAVMARVCDGFIGNRMVERYALRGYELVAEGASPRQVDEAMEKFGMAMGPFAMSDLSGNDIAWVDRKRRVAESADYRYPGFADEICEKGWFGQKTGRGWYRYEPGDRTRHAHPEADALIADWRKRNGITPRDVSPDEIVERCVYALTNEGARILEEGIAQRASDIDTVYVSGYGFPAFRGGPIHYAESVGLSKVRDRIMSFHAAAPEKGWAPADLLMRRAEAGRFDVD